MRLLLVDMRLFIDLVTCVDYVAHLALVQLVLMTASGVVCFGLLSAA